MSRIRATVTGGQGATRKRLEAFDSLYSAKEQANAKIYRCIKRRDNLIGWQTVDTLAAARTDWLYEGDLGPDTSDFALPPTVDETLTENAIASTN